LLALREAFVAASADHGLGVVVLTGAGERAFSTGADLAEQQPFLEHPNDYWAWMGTFIDAIDAIRDCPKPTIARLNGIVVGGGNELNLACDLAVAADDISIRQIGPSRGSVPSGGATQWLPIVIGDRRAREMLFLNRPIPAAMALEWGLVNRVVPRPKLDEAVDDLSGELLAKLPETIRATKAQVHFWKDLAWGLTIRHAREWLTIHAASAEVAEGLASFHEKRPLDYEGLRRAMAADPDADRASDADRSTDAGGAADPQRSATEASTATYPESCPRCGRGPLPAGYRFCGYCGQSLRGAP
jgi:enoyl-CoA hydratase/carnithine racemase